MAPTATATTTTAIHNHHIGSARPPFARSLRKPAGSASTPDLNSLYISQSRLVPPGLALSRKTSLAALTPSSLASIPDVSESYALDSVLSDATRNMVPPSPGRLSAEDLAVGDVVDVPGGMHGVVRFIGGVQGKKGIFAGVELHSDFAARGKNSGDVDGISYFATVAPGAGIFVPLTKTARRGVPTSSYPATPSANGLRNGVSAMSFTPPTPSLPKFSASIGPGVRAASPQLKKPRTSLPRPDSPARRTQMTPGPRPSIGTPAARVPSRYGSPTNKFAQSVRGTTGDPSKRLPALEVKSNIGPRSASALGSVHGLDDDATPTGLQRTKTNGSSGSISSFNLKLQRPASRAAAAQEEEMERLRSQLEDRERQLRDQSSTLAEMESSLTELQGLIENPEGPRPRRNSIDDKDTAQLRHMLREKNEKIAILTAEFDAHRADFRSTIDTLEMASTETERVYEKRIEELMAELHELESRNLDVDSVASQLKQLEELVQELEEGLEDARRGEAEARGEAEFLRGEVERTRTELRRERDKGGLGASTNGDAAAISKELEQKEDEIRGLKAIIHSLSRDSIPGGDEQARSSSRDSADHNIARDNLERQITELQMLLQQKTIKEEELEQELDMLRGGAVAPSNAMSNQRSSLRDSRDTVIAVRAHEPRSPQATHKRGNTLDTMHESDTYSTATETSTLWCEICETSGHDILTCTNMFDPEAAKSVSNFKPDTGIVREGLKPQASLGRDDALPAPLSPVKPKTPSLATTTPPVKILPNPMESGPVAGKESGMMDPEKWCAVCERDGHDSVDCPFEDAF
ncbi:hypothetical protein JDV02_001137 [Purpureocillium takamizusanense]|uniref:CAP-Gly domain-containing protein n=1 Tax=Purpureocillium takamizusanense TaxID=2060973 RepID=A0A9Q8Q8J4_9HYPO|nr:uncharacterized protein JDV02_001137 [Purpureocillium takamizusanense]UNI14519.1 hypothetical protein JDV02_001137 [Purpureocillium takamizusanense]